MSLEPERFSARYAVRALTEDDIPTMLALCRTNPFFYEVCGAPVTEDVLRHDLSLVPEGIARENKHFVGFFDGARLAAMLDLLDGYPEDGSVFIGFFMVDGTLSGQGLGSRVIDELCAYLRACGRTGAQLGYDKDNPQSTHFWNKNGFVPRREVRHEYSEGCFGQIIVAERKPI